MTNPGASEGSSIGTPARPRPNPDLADEAASPSRPGPAEPPRRMDRPSHSRGMFINIPHHHMAANETLRRRPATSQVQESNNGEESTSYEPPDGVPSGTIFFQFNKFQHNSKIAFFTVPSACLLAMFGGQTTVGILVAGILVIYLLDFYGWKESTFVATWVTVSTVAVTLITSSIHLFTISMYNIALVYNMLIFACGIGVWATLQFTFLQQQNQRMILLFERLLFAILPSSPPVIMTWAAVATYGMESAPYFLLAFLTVGYWLFVMPTRSSFRVVGKGRSKSLTSEMDELDELVMGRFESAVHNVSFVMLPIFLKYAIHHTHLVSSKDDVADLLLLSTIPLLVIAASSHRGSLWWLGFSATTLSSIRKTLVTLTSLIIVGSLEIRVVFHSFSQYIKIPPPWDAVTITCGMYLMAVIGLAHLGGLLESERMTMMLTLGGGAGIGCFCLALGVPAYMTPFGLAAAFFCARFYYHKRLQDYCSFVGAATLVIFWFIIRSFMFLEFEFDPLPMSLQHVCLVLMGVVVTSLLMPGLLSVNKVEWINSLVLCFHALGVSVIEAQLHCQFEGIYPAYLVVLTSAGGLALADHLFRAGKLGTVGAWGMGCLYAGKLGLLLYPTPWAWPSTLLLVFTFSPIYVGVVVLQRPHQSGLPPPPPYKLSRGAGTGLLLAAAASLMATRHTVVAALLRGTLHGVPGESVVLGTVCVAWTVGCSGVVTYHFPQSARLRRALAMVLCAGAALVLVQPDLDWARSWSPVPSASPSPPPRGPPGPRWPRWCLFGAAVAGLVLAGGWGRRGWVTQGVVSGAGGLLGGLYFGGAFLPYSPGLLGLLAAACALAAQVHWAAA